MKIAAAAYPIDRFDDWSGYEAKLTAWVAEAAGQGADLLVFPEYGAMELAMLDGAAAAAGLEASLVAVSARIGQASALHARLARDHGVHILGASAPVWQGARPVNRARLFGPQGEVAHQDKQIMTRFEREEWDVHPGGGLALFDTALGRIGVLICYDCQFPLLARALIEAGAEILLVPSCTDTLAGYWRVRVGAMARALEGQCVVVQSPTVGAAPWCPAVDVNIGAAAIYGPPDAGFPPTGILAEGALNAPGWVYAEIDRAAIARVRAAGQVLNRAHWPEQSLRSAPVARVPFHAFTT
ncbi:carbon-nitrogen hydrolase family protein [Rhodovulum sp. MB263]|uniref:carbon-nitrogen hydrolase family protein n=1 Tax=Rhodovulum sp. (strain MB263) TaxID=308754 RepID=UPI0009B75CF8|nr:carbon-nitrogen hydrolase family protein [Rhodovulum sp. MB263]ARC90613.1 amidohydrolase [Rhodovulum sp. MB263]